jgi:hypothetical protein
MPDKEDKAVAARAKRDLRQGKRPTTAAGEFVREEIEHVRKGKHGARSPQQAIAIGLSKARRAGVPLKPPARGKTSARTRKAAEREYEIGQGKRTPRAPSHRRALATQHALEKESHASTSHAALSAHARRAGKQRTAGHRSAKHAARTRHDRAHAR